MKIQSFNWYHSLITNNQCPYCLQDCIVWQVDKLGDQCSHCKNIFLYKKEEINYSCEHKKNSCFCVKSEIQHKMTINLFFGEKNYSLREIEQDTVIDTWLYQNDSWQFIERNVL